MNERIANNIIEGPEPPHSELQHDQQEMMDRKWENLEDVKNNLHEVFGVDHLPKEFVQHDVLPIRRKIREQVESQNYVEELGEESRKEALNLAYLIAHFREERRPVETAEKDDTGDISVTFRDGEDYHFNANERRLAEDLENYFDAYRLTRNASKFRKNVKEAEVAAAEDNSQKRRAFLSEKEKRDEVSKLVFEKYKGSGFTEKEITELIKIEGLSPDDVHEISVLRGLGEIWDRYVAGDKGRFVALSAALSLPAAIEGVAPRFLASAFGDHSNSIQQLAIYSALSLGASGILAYYSKKLRGAMVKNFAREGGYDEHVAENLTALPGQEIAAVGTGAVRERVNNGRSSYEWMVKVAAYETIPSVVMLSTSAIALGLKSPALAGATAASMGLVLALDKFAQAKSGMWDKSSEMKKKREELSNRTERVLNAHLEMVLSGQREKFTQYLVDNFGSDRETQARLDASRDIVKVVRDSFKHLNYVTAGLVSLVGGGGGENFINALLYMVNSQEGTKRLLEMHTKFKEGLQDMTQMEILFNGYADVEKEKEKSRVAIDEIEGGDLVVKNAGYAANGNDILHDINLTIPRGQMVSLRGGSGAGKSTLLKVLSGYYQPVSGSVELGNKDLGDIKRDGPKQLHSRVAYLSQEPLLLDGQTLRENLCFGVSSEVTDAEINAVLEEVGLRGRFKNLNEALIASREGASASGGEKQRIGLARMILKLRKDQLQLAFIDEPTAALDEDLKVQIGRIVNEEKKRNPDVTFIAISHDAEFRDQLENAREIVLEKGKVVAQ